MRIIFKTLSRTYHATDFNEEHCGCQKLIERYEGVTGQNLVFYVDENGESRLLFLLSDRGMEALIELIEKRGRAPNPQEKELANVFVDGQLFDNFE